MESADLIGNYEPSEVIRSVFILGRWPPLTSQVKTASTKWLKAKSHQCHDFSWQAGYGAWSVSAADVQSKIEYIQNQEEHHKHVSFQDEYRALLDEQGIEYDERYMWD